MNIKERIEKLGTYFHSMNVAAENNIIYVRVQFPKGWGCSELTEYNYKVTAVNDEVPGYFYFFADMEIGFDKVFDAIEYNIQFNEEAQAKVTLLREKIEELKNIFETEDINVLKTLEFKLKKKPVKKVKNKTQEIIDNGTISATLEDTTNKQCVISNYQLTEEETIEEKYA